MRSPIRRPGATRIASCSPGPNAGAEGNDAGTRLSQATLGGPGLAGPGAPDAGTRLSQATLGGPGLVDASWNETRRAARSRDAPRRGPSTDRTGRAAPRVMAYRIGFDVGGTFTDFVLQSPSGEL